MNDRKMFKWLALLITLPLLLAIFGGDRFRYPCQDPANWDKEICQKPLCDVTRTCPEHVFKGNSNSGMPDASNNNKPIPQFNTPQGVNCGK